MSYKEFDHQVSTLDLVYIAGQIMGEETALGTRYTERGSPMSRDITEAHTLYEPRGGYSTFAIVLSGEVLLTATEAGNLVMWNMNEPPDIPGFNTDERVYDMALGCIERMLKQGNCNLNPAPTWMREQLSNP